MVWRQSFNGRQPFRIGKGCLLKSWDVIVIGASAAGLIAAWRSAARGLKTLVLEKNKKLGVKILMSGGTRCNVTHNTDRRGIIEAFGNNGKFLHSALSRFGPSEVVDTLHNCGVETKVEATGKIFPISNRAIDVRDALVGLCQSNGSVIHSAQDVSKIETAGDLFRVATQSTQHMARNVIICVGGKSYPGCGTTGDGYQWAEQFGHTIIDPVPSLAPIVTGDIWPRELKGITIHDCGVSVIDAESKKVLGQNRNSLLFTHFGFSGPAAMNVSRFIDLHPQQKTRLSVDFFPDQNREQLREQFLRFRNENAKQSIDQMLAHLPKRLVMQLFAQCEIKIGRPSAELSKTQLNALLQILKQVEFSISGTRGFAKAEVTAGGVDLKEVNSSTMESKLQRRLFFAGEILDLDGPIGGFNFQSAFSTGFLAGESCQ